MQQARIKEEETEWNNEGGKEEGAGEEEVGMEAEGKEKTEIGGEKEKGRGRGMQGEEENEVEESEMMKDGKEEPERREMDVYYYQGEHQRMDDEDTQSGRVCLDHQQLPNCHVTKFTVCFL